MKRNSIHGATPLRFLLMALLACVDGIAWAQQTENHYTDRYDGVSISNVSIKHKPAKWYSFRQEGVDYHDSFNDGTPMTTTLNGIDIQAANTYVDTIYMHKGTSIDIDIPQTNNGGGTSSSTKSYNFWFDFRTGGNLYCNYTDGNKTIYDLLTLKETQDGIYFYRFANGYAGGVDLVDSNRRMQHMTFYYPTDEEFDAMKTNNGSFQALDNNFYVLACDVSIYNDCAKEYVYGGSTFGEANEWYEPTLCGRDIYYIIGVEDEESQMPSGFEHYWLLTDSSYQGGTNTGREHYIEEYEMTFPAFHFSNYTDEMVTLSKDAQAYAIPGGSDTSSTPLTVSFADDDNEQGFKLTGDGTVAGTTRVIQFYCGSTKTAWRVDDGATATILVTKETDNKIYNIARYKLTFKNESSPLTQAQVGRLVDIVSGEKVEDTYWWDDLRERSSIYMNKNYQLLTSLKFDYSEEGNASGVLEGGKSQFYAFPLAWDNCGYAFYDGCADDDINNNDNGYAIDGSTRGFTRWGMYSITNSYIASDSNSYATVPTNLGKHDTSYWMYVDASDRPGSIAELTFEEKLCQGSKLYVSGWLKSENSTQNDGAVLLTIMGVAKNADGTETHTPIHRHCSGQIRFTGSPLDGANQPDEPTPPSDITGKGTGHNQWLQFYFTFVNQGNDDYDYYTLKVENYCASSTGGDFDIDDIEVYVLHPKVEMTQLEPICTTDDDKSLTRMDLDYESMMSRLGFEPGDYVDDETAMTSVDFVIINEAKYYNALAMGRTKRDAFKTALVTFYGNDGNSVHQFPTLNFYLDYTKNEKYDEEDHRKNIVSFDGKDEAYFFYRMSDSEAVEISMDCYTDMMAYTNYFILLEPHTETDKTSDEKLDEFIALLDDECAIKTEFYLTAATILKLNGETLDPTADYCVGQEFVLSPEVTYTDEDGNAIYLDDEIYFDWFFGSREEYVAANETYNGVSLQEALLAFRTYYPNEEELSKTETPPTGGGDVAFTQNHYDIIEHYLGQTRLRESHLDLRILTTGIELVLQPIAVEVTAADGKMLNVCFGYVTMTLMASGDAPTLKAGFSNINYPDADYEPCLRLGVAQMEKCGEDTPFTINLCNATYATEEGVDHLGVADGMDVLLLVDTDDPTYHETILGKENETEIVVGKVMRLFATTENSDDPRMDAPSGVEGSYMQIYFYGEDEEEAGWSVTPFTVREGCYYVLSVYFQEKGSFDDGEQAVGTSCWGTFPLEIKVVPEYLVWQGGKDDNWNNDNHWHRADKDELNKPSTDSYVANEENGTDNGFVPMLFSKVVIPKDGMAELYMAGFKEGADGTLSWVGDEDTANHDDVSEHPTSNIVYDMMLYETVAGTTSSFKTEHYRVNICNEIHFEPGAQLLHSEQLLVDTVWTEVEVPQASWKNVSMPLNNVYAGDWYTKAQTGTETGEYFKYITFDSSTNNRYEPEVYQRSWSAAGDILFDESANERETTAYAKTAWSSTYNDSSVPYRPGEGYSVKTFWGMDTSNGVVFRFPKADTEFDYSSASLDRTSSGQLLISKLVDRTDPDGDASDVYVNGEENASVSVSLTKNTNNYYIIGNPYTAHMSMKAFMEKNSNVKSYWLEGTYGPIAGSVDTSSEGYDDVLILPYGAFFANIEEDEKPTVTFTKDMQKNTEENALVWFSLRATNSIGTTSASLAYDDSASDGYYVGEDVVMMEDTSWQRDGMPVVYTVAGQVAVSVNKLSTMPLIPLGVFADDDCAYTLTFVGVDCLNEPVLINTYEKTETALTEGFTLDMKGASHGRYFICAKGAATEISLTENEVCDITAYSPTPGTVIVSSTAELEDIGVYSIGGMLLSRVNASGNYACTIEGINSGVAIVHARTSEGTFVKKLRVR